MPPMSLFLLTFVIGALQYPINDFTDIALEFPVRLSAGFEPNYRVCAEITTREAVNGY